MLAQILLGVSSQDYNGHKQITIKGLTVEQGIEIIKELEEVTNHSYDFVLEVWGDGNFTLYQKNFWKEGEHPLNHKDRIILGSE